MGFPPGQWFDISTKRAEPTGSDVISPRSDNDTYFLKLMYLIAKTVLRMVDRKHPRMLCRQRPGVLVPVCGSERGQEGTGYGSCRSTGSVSCKTHGAGGGGKAVSEPVFECSQIHGSGSRAASCVRSPELHS